MAPPVAALAVDVRADDALVGRHRRLDRGVLLRRDPAQIDLRIVENVALPAGLRIDRHADLDLEAGRARLGHRGEPLDVGHRLLGRLADGEAPVEAEHEAVRHRAVARRIEIRPGGRAGAVAEECVVEEALALLVFLGRLLDDGAAELERVEAFPRHRAVAGAARHRHLDLHAAALAAIDAERALLGVAGRVGEDDDVGNELGLRARQHVAHDVHRAGAVIVLLACTVA